MKRPLAWFALFFSLGIFVAYQTRFPFWLIYSSALIFLVIIFLAFRKGLKYDSLLFFLAFLLGALILKNSQSLPKCHISKYVSYKNNYLYTVKGSVLSEPIFRNNKTAFIFKAQEIAFDNLKYNCCGNVLVYIRGKISLSYAQSLILTGNLYRPFYKKHAKQRSYRDYLYRQGIFSILNVKAACQVSGLNNKCAWSPKRFALRLKNKMEAIIFKYVSLVPASIIDAMILGERKNLSPLVNNSMIKSGTVHILVVSGFNVGIVTFIIILFLKLMRIPKRMRVYIAIPLLIVYCLMTGASTPVVRATVMAIVFIVGFLIKREPDIYNSCAVAWLFILGLNPRQLFDIGLELSFASVLSIVYLYPKLKSLLRIESLNIKYVRFLIDGCLVSFSAWLGTLGFIAYYFRIFSPITVLANLFIVPLATLITLCGFSLVFIGLIYPPLAPILARTSELCVAFLLNINAFLIKLPSAYFYLY